MVVIKVCLSNTDHKQSKTQSIALRHLYRDHHGWLYNWLRHRLGCSHNAADLTHDIFIKVLLRDKQGVVIRKPKAYLSQIANGLLVNFWRHKEIESNYLEALALLPEPQAPSEEQNQLILETLYEVDAALNGLPRQVKQAFLLAQLEGVKYRDIALKLNVAEITVKRYVKQALLQCLLVME